MDFMQNYGLSFYGDRGLRSSCFLRNGYKNRKGKGAPGFHLKTLRRPCLLLLCNMEIGFVPLLNFSRVPRP